MDRHSNRAHLSRPFAAFIVQASAALTTLLLGCAMEVDADPYALEDSPDLQEKSASKCSINSGQIKLSCSAGQIISDVSVARYSVNDSPCGRLQLASCRLTSVLERLSETCIERGDCSVSLQAADTKPCGSSRVSIGQGGSTGTGGSAGGPSKGGTSTVSYTVSYRCEDADAGSSGGAGSTGSSGNGNAAQCQLCETQNQSMASVCSQWHKIAATLNAGQADCLQLESVAKQVGCCAPAPNRDANIAALQTHKINGGKETYGTHYGDEFNIGTREVYRINGAVDRYYYGPSGSVLSATPSSNVVQINGVTYSVGAGSAYRLPCESGKEVDPSRYGGLRQSLEGWTFINTSCLDWLAMSAQNRISGHGKVFWELSLSKACCAATK